MFASSTRSCRREDRRGARVSPVEPTAGALSGLTCLGFGPFRHRRTVLCLTSRHVILCGV